MSTTQYVGAHATDIADVVTVSHWYAVYTFPRHEKAVSEQMRFKGVEFYLPLFEKLSKWKDRVSKIHLPLFPGYVFVRIPLNQRGRVLSLPGVIRIVSFNGRPAPLPETDIETLRAYLAYHKAEPHPYLCAGKRVRVSRGALDGLEGVVVRRKGQTRFVVSIDSIHRSVALEVDAADLLAA